MVLPEVDFQTHPEMLKFGSWLYDRTGKLYMPDEMETMNKGYLVELFAWRDGPQFHIDYPKRDPHFK